MKREVSKSQQRWAKSAGIEFDERGYVEAYGINLCQPISPSTLSAFTNGDGAELKPQRKRPAKMCALHSSGALAVNMFDHWVGRDAGPLLKALGIDGRLKVPPQFEQQFPASLTGNPPNLDVVLELDSGISIAIESKFTEWMVPKRKGRPAFKDKYFEGGSRLWERAGLPFCQALAEDLRSGVEFFRLLDAPQLLKHALGLATQRPGRFALYYLYFDATMPLGEQHRLEVARFTSRVGDELRFESITYQEIYRRLLRQPAVDPAYLAYVGARYFADIFSERDS